MELFLGLLWQPINGPNAIKEVATTAPPSQPIPSQVPVSHCSLLSTLGNNKNKNNGIGDAIVAISHSASQSSKLQAVTWQTYPFLFH